MIPKIIHICWLSGDAFPTDIIKCLETFPTHLSDYEIYLWGKIPNDVSCFGNMKITEKHFDLDSTPWTKEAFEAKKYAFAADYIRLYALYNYGGIYLDADVVIYKSFNELLQLPYFIGADRIGSFEAAVVGCEKGCKWIGDILKRYDNRPFITERGEYDMFPLPGVFRNCLIEYGYRFNKIENLAQITHIDFSEKCIIYVFDADFFNSRNHIKVKRTKKSFCAHNYLGSWQKQQARSLKEKTKQEIPGFILDAFFTLSHATWNKHKYDSVIIPFEE